MVYVDGVGLSEGGLLSLEAEDVFTSPKQRPRGGRYGEIGAHACQIIGRMGRYEEIWGDREEACSALLRCTPAVLLAVVFTRCSEVRCTSPSPVP